MNLQQLEKEIEWLKKQTPKTLKQKLNYLYRIKHKELTIAFYRVRTKL